MAALSAAIWKSIGTKRTSREDGLKIKMAEKIFPIGRNIGFAVLGEDKKLLSFTPMDLSITTQQIQEWMQKNAEEHIPADGSSASTIKKWYAFAEIQGPDVHLLTCREAHDIVEVHGVPNFRYRYPETSYEYEVGHGILVSKDGLQRLTGRESAEDFAAMAKIASQSGYLTRWNEQTSALEIIAGTLDEAST